MQETSRLYEQSGSELHDPPPNHRIHEPVYYPAYSGPGHAPVFAPSRYAALGAALGTDPRTEFYNKFQGEIEEHDRDFEKKYGGDLDTTLIFSGLFSAVTSAFIIDVQSDLKPDYEEMNNTLLEMLLNATTGTLPADSAAPVPRWSGPDPAIVQVQCILYAALSATLLASFLAMLGKQWLNRYRQSETHGSTADRSRVHERKLNGVETWKFRLIMESLPVILQCALVLLGFALSRYLWGINRSVSSVLIGFTSFGFLFYLLLVTVSIFSFDCPFQTPFSLAIRFAIGLAVPYWWNLRRTFEPKQQPPPPQPRTPRARRDLPFTVNTVSRGESEVSTTSLPCITPAATKFPRPDAPLFIQEAGVEEDRLDARCITRMFVMSTDPDVVTLTMDFIPEIVWHNGIKDVPLKHIHDTLIDCFNFSGPSPVVIPKLRNVAYLSARAFVHIELQRRCITQYEEHRQDGWEALCTSHPLSSSAGDGPDSDLEAVLFMVDMTLGHDNGFSWKEIKMTSPHHAWMSHVFLYHVWHEKKLSKVVMDFVEDSMSPTPPNDIVTTDCLFIIGLMIGVPFHVSDITVQDKSRKKESVLRKIFRALSVIFSSKSIQTQALHALWLITQLAASDVSVASCELFKTIMAPKDLTDQHWEAARYAIRGAFQASSETPLDLGGPELIKRILKFLDYHLGLPWAEADYMPSVTVAFGAVVGGRDDWPDHLTVECIRNFNCASPSFVKGVRSMMHPNSLLGFQEEAVRLVSLVSNQWFNSTVPVMRPEEMSEFCEHLAMVLVDGNYYGSHVLKSSVTILFGMFRSPEWRKHIVPSLWSVFAHCDLVEEEEESFRWCLRNAIELLDFMRGLPDGEGLKWWYVTLWFHYDKLDITVRDEAERIARDMSRSDYLDLIGGVVMDMRKGLYRRQRGSGMSNGSDVSSESDVELTESEAESRGWLTETPSR